VKRARFRDRVGHAITAAVGPLFIRALGRTLRVTRRGEPDREGTARGTVATATATPLDAGALTSPRRRPLLYAVWHGRVIPFVATHSGRGIVGLVSEHRDGEYIARVLEPLGFGVVRGSTTRGGSRALFDMAQRAREGRDIAITPDGPHGPTHAVRPGVIALAQRAGTPIIPVGVAARGLVFPTWDRFLVPRPWARVAVVYGEPLVTTEREAALDACRDELAARILCATEEADRLVNRSRSRGIWLGAYRALTHGLEAAVAPAALLLRALGRDGLASRLAPVRGLPRRAIWVHAASVGEILGVRPLLAAMRSAWPDVPIVVSTMTRTGLSLAREPASCADAAFLVPPDLPGALRRAYDAIDPRALVLAETELWPNFLCEAHERGVPIAIVNARLSPKRFPRYRAGRPLFCELLRSVGWIAAQTPADRERFVALGANAERVEVLGSTKDDVRIEGPAREEIRRSLGLAPDALVLIFGSARGAEAALFAAAARDLLARFPSLRILYAPRHLDRVEEIVRSLQAACEAAEGPATRGDAAPAPSPVRADAAVRLTAWRRAGGEYRALVVDTIGELRTLYAAADVAVVGGSFSQHGGHNPLEPAVSGVPILMGPSREHVRDAFARLEAAGGAEAASDGADLVQRAARLLGDAPERARRARALRVATADTASVAQTIVERLVERGIVEPDLPARRGTQPSSLSACGNR
jgi:3-deoxy-D-manno-octulosonic-acid transferase